MSREVQLTLFQSAASGARIIRQMYIVQFIVDGNGAFVTPTMDFNAAEKWASSRNSTGARMTDRTRFLDKLEVLISRPGSFISTRGSSKPLEDLCKAMKAAGYDLGEWQLPHDLKEMFKPKKAEPPVKKAQAADGGDSA